MTLFFATATEDGRTVDTGRLDAAGRAIASAGDAAPEIGLTATGGWVQVPFHCTPGGDGGLYHDDQVTVLGEFRLDDRARLLDALAGRGHRIGHDASDGEVVAAAYAEWDLDAVGHLHGDYGFAVLDHARRRVVLVADAFSTVPLYWSTGAGALWVSNWLDAEILAADAADAIDDDYVCDYLLFGLSHDPQATIHRAIRKVPPASLVVLPMDGGATRVDRHWTAPARPARSARRRASDWVEGLAYHLDQAVSRRLGAGETAFTLTAGLDSAMALAMAVRRRQTSAAHRLRAYCMGYDWLLPDEERHYASLSADHLGVDFVTMAADDIQGRTWRRSFRPRPEPRLLCMRRSPFDVLFERAAADGFRVLQSGLGGDVLLGGGPFRLADLRAPGHMRAALAMRHLSATMPRALLRSMVKRQQPRRASRIPSLINPDFAQRMDAGGRLRAAADRVGPDALARMTGDPFWPVAMSLGRPEFTGCRLRVRHPYFDTDLIAFAADMPVWPWCVDKAVLRMLAIDHLPPAVQKRRKYALAGSPLIAWAMRRPETDLAALVDRSFLTGYLSSSALSAGFPGAAGVSGNFYPEREFPLGLSAWLTFRRDK